MKSTLKAIKATVKLETLGTAIISGVVAASTAVLALGTFIFTAVKTYFGADVLFILNHSLLFALFVALYVIATIDCKNHANAVKITCDPRHRSLVTFASVFVAAFATIWVLVLTVPVFIR